MGMKVLLRNNRRHDRKGDKMKMPWKGPYEISRQLENGSYKLKINGKELKTAYNGSQLKVFHDKPSGSGYTLPSGSPVY